MFVVELDGEHVTPGLLWTNAQTERDVVTLNQFTHGCLAHTYALRRQRSCTTAAAVVVVIKNSLKNANNRSPTWSATLSWWWGLCTDDPDDF